MWINIFFVNNSEQMPVVVWSWYLKIFQEIILAGLLIYVLAVNNPQKYHIITNS